MSPNRRDVESGRGSGRPLPRPSVTTPLSPPAETPTEVACRSTRAQLPSLPPHGPPSLARSCPEGHVLRTSLDPFLPTSFTPSQSFRPLLYSGVDPSPQRLPVPDPPLPRALCSSPRHIPGSSPKVPGCDSRGPTSSTAGPSSVSPDLGPGPSYVPRTGVVTDALNPTGSCLMSVREKGRYPRHGHGGKGVRRDLDSDLVTSLRFVSIPGSVAGLRRTRR